MDSVRDLSFTALSERRGLQQPRALKACGGAASPCSELRNESVGFTNEEGAVDNEGVQ